MRSLFRKIAWSRFVRIVPDGLTYLGWRPRHRPPSFLESISRSVRLREIAVSQGFDFPIWRLDDKLAGREFAQEIGLRVPELYALGSLEECVGAVSRRGSGVIKPRQRHDSLGVVSLTPRGDGFFDHIRKQPVSVADLESYVRRYQVDRDDVLFAEELIFRPGSHDTPSYDWKFLCFAGETGLIFQVDRVPQSRRGRASFVARLADFSPVRSPHRRGLRQSLSLPLPFDLVALREVAEQYSLRSRAPFARIDLFEDEQGPVFGEITPHPWAGFWHTNDFGGDLDRKLGRMWEEAEIRLAAESLDRIREHE